MRFKELEHAGQTDSTIGDVLVAGLKQHELMEWYFAHQAERCAPINNYLKYPLKTSAPTNTRFITHSKALWCRPTCCMQCLAS